MIIPEMYVLDDGAPTTIAKKFLEVKRPHLKFWNGDFVDRNAKNNGYEALSKGAMKQVGYDFIEKCYVPVEDKLKAGKNAGGEVKTKLTQLRASKRSYDEFVAALEAAAYLSIETQPFSDPDIVIFDNTLYNHVTDTVIPHSPDIFNFQCLPFDYDPTLGEPVEWLKFLDSVWSYAPGNITELRKIFGYFMSGSNEYQKLFFIYGPTRSGKGTIADVLIHMLGGVDRVTSVSMENFSGSFGMESLIGKVGMIVPDMRQGKRTDLGAVVERLLTISGGDNVSVARKYKSAYIGKLACRILVMSNDVPMLPDSTGTVAQRFFPLEMKRSFKGREDRELMNRLLPELPRIMRWSLGGLRLLRQEGFVEQDNGLLKKIRVSASALQEFTEDELVIDPDARVFQDQVYLRYKEWCKDNTHAPMSHTQFKIRLEGLGIGVTQIRPTVNARPGPRMWSGIRLINHQNEVRSPFDDIQDQDDLESTAPSIFEVRKFGHLCDD